MMYGEILKKDPWTMWKDVKGVSRHLKVPQGVQNIKSR